MAKIVGIDLGTTNSCVAVLERGAARVLPNPEGERTTPSVVAFLPGGGVQVGVPARRQAVTNAGRTVFGAKRLIGRKVNAPDVKAFAQTAPYRITAAPNGDAWIRLGDRDVAPQEVAAYVLDRMRRIAEEHLGEPVTQAVVTVPAYFDDAQRQATKDAGRIAGLDVQRILNEPTAAALAYGAHRMGGRRTLAVFDLGGGTFDVSILLVDQGLFEVLAVGGNASLGGDDFDRAIVEALVAEMARTHGVDLTGDPVALGRLKEEAEKQKCALSAEETAMIRLPFLATGAGGEPVHFERTLTRAEVEAWTRPLVEKLVAPCEDALREAGLKDGVDEVLLVGGMTRMPAVQARVEAIFGCKPKKGANPDEIVAQGAALHAGVLSGEVDDAVLLDVTPQSLGIRAGGNKFSVVIPRNTMVPARARRVFGTSRANQDHVAVEIYQGDSEDVRKNRLLGRLRLEGLPPGPAGSVRVELSFLVDADGILEVTAREKSRGIETSLRVSPSGGLGDAELERIIEARRRDAGSEPSES